MGVPQNISVDGPKAAADSDLQNPSWVLAIGVALAVVLLIRFGSRSVRKFGNLPPGPRNWPIIGALLEMEPRLHKAFEKLAVKYGPIVHFRLGVQTFVVVSSAEAAEELLKNKDVEFTDRSAPMNRFPAKFLGFNSCLLPFSNYDDQLKLVKKISTSEFFTGAKLRATEETRSREMAMMVEKIFVKTETSKDDEGQNASNAVSIRGVSTVMIRNVIFTLCFGKRFDGLQSTDRLKKFPQVFDEFMRTFMVFNLIDFFPSLQWLDPQGLLKQFKRVRKMHNEFYGGILEDRRRLRNFNHVRKTSSTANDLDGNCRNFVDVLLQAQEEGGQISDDAVMGTVATMLLAGVDTTGGGIEWVLLELVRHPEVCNKLRAEIDAVVGKERPVQEADLQAMPFLQAVVMESFRLHPPVSTTFPHVNTKPSILGGYDIPPKSAVIVNIYSIGRDPKIWKDPLQFNPYRFMQDGSSPGTCPSSNSLSLMANGSNYNILPFGSGRRKCAAFDMATVLLLRTVVTLLHAFDWATPPGTSPQDLSIEEVGSFLPHPISDLLLTPTPRLSHHVYQRSLTAGLTVV